MVRNVKVGMVGRRFIITDRQIVEEGNAGEMGICGGKWWRCEGVSGTRRVYP